MAKKRTEEQRTRMSLIQKLVQARPEVKARNSASNKGKKHKKRTEEQLVNYRAGAQKRLADPDYREKCANSMKLAREKHFYLLLNDPEYSKKNSQSKSEACVKRWSQPAARKKQSQALKNYLLANPDKVEPRIRQAIRNAHGIGPYEYLDRRGRLLHFKSGEGFELGFARWLDEQELTWTYEHDVLLLSTGEHYIPDFWVEEWKTYIEIKGFLYHKKTQQAIDDGHQVLMLQGEAIQEFYAWTK